MVGFAVGSPPLTLTLTPKSKSRFVAHSLGRVWGLSPTRITTTSKVAQSRPPLMISRFRGVGTRWMIQAYCTLTPQWSATRRGTKGSCSTAAKPVESRYPPSAFDSRLGRHFSFPIHGDFSMDINSLGLACARLSECGESPRRQRPPQPKRLTTVGIQLSHVLGRSVSTQEAEDVAVIASGLHGKDTIGRAIKTYLESRCH